MNCRYFICQTNGLYIDAGYRWAYWTLEDPGIVSLGQPVDVALVLSQTEYWLPPDDEKSPWLCQEVLPAVKSFLSDYGNEVIDYVDEEFIYAQEELGVKLHEIKNGEQKPEPTG